MKSPQRIMRELRQPFKQEDLEFRPQEVNINKQGKPTAKLLAYVTNRAIQNRLDDVVGCFGWQNKFKSLPNSVGDGALCGLSLEINGKWVTKWDGADNTSIEATKGGLSGAMKRVAVQWGIGRNLYDIPLIWGICKTQEEYNNLTRDKKEEYTYAKTKDGRVLYWKAPDLHPRYLPRKMIGKAIANDILLLAEETGTNLVEMLESYGVDNIMDLFSDEAGEITKILIHRKNNMEKKNDEKE